MQIEEDNRENIYKRSVISSHLTSSFQDQSSQSLQIHETPSPPRNQGHHHSQLGSSENLAQRQQKFHTHWQLYSVTDKVRGKLLPKEITDSRKSLLFSKGRKAKLFAMSCTHMKTPFYIVLTLNILQLLFIILAATQSTSFILFYLAMIGIQLPILFVSRFFQRKFTNQITPLELIKRIRLEEPYGEWTLTNYTTSQKCFLAPEKKTITTTKTVTLTYPQHDDISPLITGLDKYKYVELKMNVNVGYEGEERISRIEKQLQKFLEKYRLKDELQEFVSMNKTKSFQSKLFYSKSGKMPWIFKLPVVIIFLIFGLEFVQYLWRELNVLKLEYCFLKVVSDIEIY